MEKDSILVSFDTSANQQYQQIAGKVCEILNGAIDKFTESGWIADALTTEQVQSMLNGNCGFMLNNIKAQFEKAMKNEPPAVKNRYQKMCTDETADAQKVFATEITEQLRANFKGLSEKSDATRLMDVIPLIKSDGGKATYDPDQIKGLASATIPYTPESIAYIKRAVKLYNDIVQFDNDTRVMGGKDMQGIGYALSTAKASVINVQGDYIDLDMRNLLWLNFAKASQQGSGKEFPERTTKIIDFEDSEFSAVGLLNAITEQTPSEPEKAGE